MPQDVTRLRDPNFDGPKMKAAIDWCRQNDIPIRRCSAWHIKFRQVNFWPHTGVVTLDDGYRHPHKGLEVFQQIVRTLIAQRSGR